MLQSAKCAINTARSETVASRLQSTPYICAHCRRAAGRQRVTTYEPSRTFTTSLTSRQQTSSSTAPQQPRRESIAPQTHYEFFPQTFPNGPPPNSSFSPDLRQLRKEFLQLQAKSHPDLAPPEQKRQAEALSSRINEAYKALQDPLKRAQYLLFLQGIDVEDDSAKLSENTLLMEVMEAREEVEEAEEEEDLVALRAGNNERIDGSVKVLDAAFAQGDLETAAQEAVRLRYWMNIDESIQGWEKGKGGGMIHH